MNIRNLDLNLLLVFDAVFSSGSVSIAAKRLNMSQPTVSSALARLRGSLKDPLFIRHAYGVTPTARAQQLAGPIHQALDLVQNAVAPSVEYDHRSDHSTFWVAMEDFGEIVLMPVLVDWLAQVAPGMKISVCREMGSAAGEAMRDGQIDLTVEYLKVAGKHIEVRHLFDEERVCVARSGHPSVGDSITLESYLALPHVTLNHRVTGGGTVNRVLNDMGLRRNVAMEVPHYLSMPIVMQHNDYIATMPRRVAMRLAAVHPLKIVKMPFALPGLEIYLKWHKSRSADPRHQWLRGSILELSRRI